uniref:Uncharacterized protein n=1 Tax=Arundo donax TaxID=35708 RepID=A0A0A9FMP1_ARUDO
MSNMYRNEKNLMPSNNMYQKNPIYLQPCRRRILLYNCPKNTQRLPSRDHHPNFM